jgi:hypothetical protein
MASSNGRPDGLVEFHPTETEVAKLIGRAKTDERGLEFLMHGAQDAVAAAFEVHAFVVDAARQRLSASLKTR